MNALLLTAGLGTRFRPITDKISKPAIPILNVPLLGYSLYHLEQIGLQNLVLNTHHLPKSVETTTECLTHQRHYKVQFSFEPQILGSGGGIKQAEKLLHAQDDFLVGNGDEFMVFRHDQGLKPLIEFHKKNRALATLLTTRHPDAGTKLGGVWAKKDGSITRLGGTHSEPDAQHFTGYFVFSPEIFKYMPTGGEFHIFKDCLHKAMAAGEKVLSYFDDQLLWLDVTSESDYIKSTLQALEVLDKEGSPLSQNLGRILKRFHQNFEKVGSRQWLCPGAQFKGALDEGAYLFMGPESILRPGAEVSGFAVMGALSAFGPGYIDSSVVAPNVHIHEVIALRKQLVVG